MPNNNQEIHYEVWAENLLLINELVQKEGGILTVNGSYTDFEGDLLISVVHPPLSKESLDEYEERRTIK